MTHVAVRNRQELSVVLILSMLFSCWLALPMPAKAGVLGTVGNIAKKVVVTAGALGTGYLGAVLGIAVGGGPIGMVAGGVAGFWVGKKALGWATSSWANFATVAGAVGGGLLMAGAGFPLLAAGVIGGALLARTVAKLFTRTTGIKNPPVVQVPNPEQDKKCLDFINALKAQEEAGSPAAAPSQSVQSAAVAPATVSVQDAYNKYLSAYKSYMEATQKGNSEAAKKAFQEYQTNLAAYQSAMSGS
jgi:hypothetical protein